MTKQVLIYFEINNGIIESVSKEILSHCVSNFGDCEINAVIIADENSINNVKTELEGLPLNKVYVLQDALCDNFNVCIFAELLADLVIDVQPDILLVGATDNGRELAPRTASKLDIGLTADCTDLQVDSDFNLLATRPTYGGKMMAVISSKTLPNFATVRPGAFKMLSLNTSANTDFVYKNLYVPALNCLLEVLTTENKPAKEDWTCSEVIIAGGLGLKTKDNFELIYKLCELVNAKPAASRAAVEQGWASPSIQVGQTGYSVSPKLYIALGISGAMQHMTGVTNADKIIAVNIDKSSPLMQSADIAINTDAVSLLNTLINIISVKN